MSIECVHIMFILSTHYQHIINTLCVYIKYNVFNDSIQYVYFIFKRYVEYTYNCNTEIQILYTHSIHKVFRMCLVVQYKMNIMCVKYIYKLHIYSILFLIYFVCFLVEDYLIGVCFFRITIADHL